MFVLGCMLAVWGTFLIPLRWPGGVEGLAVVIAVVGNLMAGWLGAVGMRSPLAGALAGVGWLVTVLLLGGGWPRPEGDVLIAAKVKADPALGTVGMAFLLGGAAAALVGVVVGAQRARVDRR